MLKAGIHISTSGGFYGTPARAAELGCEAAQLFTTNQQQWRGRVITEEGAREFRAGSVIPIISHCSYLINLASTRKDVVRRSRVAIREELARSAALGIRWVVLHPGAHLGRGDEQGAGIVSAELASALDDSPAEVGVLLENTAGQGSSLCHRFDQIENLLNMIDRRDRTGVCFDTAHAFAAGYDLSTRAGVEDTLAGIESTVGLDRVKAIHLNDSRTECGSRSDRHAHPGEGLIGLEGLALICAVPAFDGVPGIVETPGSDEDRIRDAKLIRGGKHRRKKTAP